jgi:DNA-directed RNA polymerase specialized sigma24 family protein
MSKKKATLGEREFDLLLAWLDPDRDRAANERVRLHARLTRHFMEKGCIEPEDLADTTLDRVGTILLAGKDLSAFNREAYLLRVAYYVRHEYWRRRNQIDSLPADLPDSTAFRDKEQAHFCLEECLGELPVEERLLLLEYYAEDKTAKIDTRERMARGLGISNGALRQRTSKLRSRVRACVLACIAY